MGGSQGDKVFGDSIARLYEQTLVPLIFEPYATDLVGRLSELSLTKVLEVAAGTGVVTRHLASMLPESVSIVATDLNQPMLDMAETIGTDRPVVWRQADALDLPFPDETFDAVVCQFGAMFFPDRPKAFREVHRVLKPAGLFAFNVWDRIEVNELADAVTQALESLFPEDPPRFLARTPHGYCDPEAIGHDLAAGGFSSTPRIDTVTARGRSESPRVPAVAYCQGTPLRNEIEARDASPRGDATPGAANAIAERFGSGSVDSKIQALVVTIAK
jgi:SAM-dependent methyltransferase